MMTPTRSLVSTAAATALAALLASAPACGGSSTDAPAAASPQAAHAAPGHGAGEHAGHGQHHAGPPQHSFERAEDWARLFDHPSREAWQKPDEVVALVDLSPGMSVVDVGAGTGYFMTRLSRAVGPRGSVVATDIEPDMVRYMKERAAREKLANVQVVTAPVDDVGRAGRERRSHPHRRRVAPHCGSGALRGEDGSRPQAGRRGAGRGLHHGDAPRSVAQPPSRRRTASSPSSPPVGSSPSWPPSRCRISTWSSAAGAEPQPAARRSACLLHHLSC